MPPITGVPTYGSAAINPNTTTTPSHASGTTPQTASLDTEHQDNEPTVTATEATTSTWTYPPSRPGAAPAPAPTGATPSPYTSTPTTTYTTENDTSSPPAPQPGARPIPPPSDARVTQTNTNTLSDLPPPPKVGEVPKPASYYTRATSTAIATSNTAGFSSGSSSDVNRPFGPNSTSTPYGSVYQPPANNTLSTAYAAGVREEEEEGIGQEIWKTAKSWLQTAGEKLAEVEAEVWRRVG